jgi:AraC-like DNA-binding protein
MTTLYTACYDAKSSAFAKAFWQTQGEPDYQTETILPTGVVELIFSFSDHVSFNVTSQTSSALTPRCFITGMSDTPVQLYMPQKQTFFGVQLRPSAVKKLLKIPAGQFLNTITDIEAVNKEFTSLWHELADCDSYYARVNIMQHWLAHKRHDISEQEAAIADFLGSSAGSVNVTGLASQFCYSTRQLHRKMKEFFGMSTEGLIRYKRYMHSLHQMHNSTETLTRISYDCQYYDQAHFIREFLSFTGLTPGEYRKQKSHLPGHLYRC